MSEYNFLKEEFSPFGFYAHKCSFGLKIFFQNCCSCSQLSISRCLIQILGLMLSVITNFRAGIDQWHYLVQCFPLADELM